MIFVNSMINDFESKEHDPMIPSFSFKDFEWKSVVPFCNKDVKASQQALKQLKVFTKKTINLELFLKQRNSGSFLL